MNYLLIKYNNSWADEFNINCLWVTTEEEFEEWKEDLLRRDVSEYEEIYLGTNEWVNFYSSQEIIDSLSIERISKSFYVDFINMIGETFGLINLKELPEQYNYLDE